MAFGVIGASAVRGRRASSESKNTAFSLQRPSELFDLPELLRLVGLGHELFGHLRCISATAARLEYRTKCISGRPLVQFHLGLAVAAVSKIVSALEFDELVEDRREADERLAKLVTKYHQSVPKLAAWLEASIPERTHRAELTAAFERKTGNRSGADDAKDRQIAQLQEKIAQKNEVVAELRQEHVQLKKELGEL